MNPSITPTPTPCKTIKKPNPEKGKMQPRTTGSQRLRALTMHKEDPSSKFAPGYQICRWKKQEKDLLQRPVEELRSKTYFLKKKDNIRITGAFPVQQLEVLKRLTKRRGIGKHASTKWIRNEMFLVCDKDRPVGFDVSKTSQFGSHCVGNYQHRHYLSVRRRTNKKKTSVFERLRKIHGYHSYTQYDMAFADISSEESESSEEDSDSSEEDSDSSEDESSSDDSEESSED